MNNIILPFFFFTIVLASCSPSAKKENDSAAAPDKTAQQNELPNMLLTYADGTKLFAKEIVGKKAVLVLFQPDCDHCQAEGKQIHERANEFEAYTIYFISASSHAEMKKYAEDLKLNTHKSFHFVSTDVQSILDSYGPISAPSVYIYSETGKLLSKFNGQTDIEKIVKAL